ncbi:ATP-binding protein [Chryseosolibacter indicus]|uniref:ATP-binding protein n=1 Tax=Chryseosolibacter indicus TaxID=2782351 RepID=A0ABS5VKW9_9BACT|nr:ATP-binding protein [Chryseosolibacter indicus]MBT1701741.1 ATP-binding protein [Chryseosolibacter indicus]
MESRRILNRIIFINIANTDYSSVEIAGNTCFVGTNNMGKTTLQRAILFFYSANTRGLGISSSQKTFEDYYFQFPNSYIIYEIATEEGLFHVMVYRNNKLFYRFVESEFVQDHYIVDNEALLPKAVVAKFNEHRIHYSDQIETFERYRNIIYGADPDKKYKKFALMKGNANYHNIPLAITSIFLSSESVIKAEFVKECIANSISSKHTTIELKTIERQLRQFTERYHDIETFFRKENAQRSDLIKDNFSSIQQLKVKQRALASELGGALKYAALQKDTIGLQVAEKKDLLVELESEFREREIAHQEQNKETNQEIGALKSKLKEADKKLKEYEEKGIHDLLREAEEKEKLQVELQARETEYATLTAGFSDVEQQFKTLFNALENERKEFEHVLSSQGLQLDKKYHEDKNALRDAYRKEESELKERHAVDADRIRQLKNQKELDNKDAEFREKEIKRKRYFDQEVTMLKGHLEEISRRKFERTSALAVRNNNIDSLRKEGDHIREKNRITSEQYIERNKQEIAVLEEKIKTIDEKLSVHQHALFGYLQDNYPNWFETIGKVVNEELLFNKELNPKLIKKGIESLYGIQLDLSHVKVYSKTLEEYEQERTGLREQIVALNHAFLEFREEQTREEQSKLASIGKKTAQLKSEITQLEYEAAQDEQKEKQYNLDLHEWQRKGEEQREKDAVQIYTYRDNLDKEINELRHQLSELESILKKGLSDLQESFNEKLAKLNKTFDKEIEKIRDQKEEKLGEFDERKAQLQKEKSAVLKKKGIDDTRIKKLKKDIDEIKTALRNLDKHAELLNDYRKDKRELFDHMDDFRKEKERLDAQIKQSDALFAQERELFSKRKKQMEDETRALAESLKKYVDGLEHFERHFRDRTLYDRLRHIIDPAPAEYAEAGIIGLCSQLLANDTEFHNQFEKFRNNVSEFAGRFRPDNHLNFKINPGAGEGEYERFAAYLQDFYNENKIQISIAEVAKSHGMLIDAISSKMKALTEHKGRINKMINKMEADFSKASFEGSKLIEYIKLKSEDSENKVLRKLQKITEFREQNPFLYGEANLFNTNNKAKSEIDKKSVELLNDLQKTISEEKNEEIRVQDLFELRFRIKEGKNDTGWIEKIDKVGSTGTDMLVKAVIYITLLNVFIKESTEKTARNFSVHCIIDEVGQISAPYLKELINFAEERNICLINGLPNESKLETHYNYTYKFRKDANGFVKVVPLLTMSIEP